MQYTTYHRLDNAGLLGLVRSELGADGAHRSGPAGSSRGLRSSAARGVAVARLGHVASGAGARLEGGVTLRAGARVLQGGQLLLLLVVLGVLSLGLLLGRPHRAGDLHPNRVSGCGRADRVFGVIAIVGFCWLGSGGLRGNNLCCLLDGGLRDCRLDNRSYRFSRGRAGGRSRRVFNRFGRRRRRNWCRSGFFLLVQQHALAGRHRLPLPVHASVVLVFDALLRVRLADRRLTRSTRRLRHTH